METIDEETMAAAEEFITRQVKEGKALLLLVDGTRMHFRTHVKAKHRGISGRTNTVTVWSSTTCKSASCFSCSMTWASPMTLSSSIRRTTVRTTHLARPGRDPIPVGEELRLGGRLPRPLFRALAGAFPWVTLTGIVSYEDSLPTFAAAAGDTEIVEKLRQGVELNGRKYRNCLDG
jgi:hypothetical protein